MVDLEARLAALEGKLGEFVSTLQGQIGAIKGEVLSLDEGALAALETSLGEVEATRAFLIEQLAKVEARAAALRPA